ncbi:hypothetical protein QUB63_20310 [Microcoleus sp. ARI1-B5]|uniref:hypothetical protein n=1 Tax=unclassified Microcoleus TaxID=2642155 RepID=UPI002FD1ADF9
MISAGSYAEGRRKKEKGRRKKKEERRKKEEAIKARVSVFGDRPLLPQKPGFFVDFS